jgi:hypothetical protein
MSVKQLETLVAATLLVGMVSMARAQETAKPEVGFRGTITGTVKSVEGGTAAITVEKAEPDPGSTVKDGSVLAGKDVAVSARWKTAHAVDPESKAYIQSLKAGDRVTLTVFWEAKPQKLRLAKPPAPTTPPSE